jgi:UDP-N-acetylglucosamine--N-acetylmuramyl-(pentapeptide) pyrophosphoryl-undecaprenol N-acetylglucosamine transferase
VFVGSRRGIEAQAVPEVGFRLRTIVTRGFPRRAWWRWPVALAANAIGFVQALWVVASERPDVVLGTGGYVSGPVALAARVMGRPLLLQEQNSIPGLSNRWLARIADEVHLSFTESRAYFHRKDHLKITGNPVRSYILSGDRATAMREFGLSEGKPTVFVFGGSRGAHRINEAGLDAMRRLKGRVDVQFILQTGREDFESAKKTVEAEQLPARVVPFLRQIHLAYAAADLVVCRSGAMTLAEIAVCGTPAILIPYPYAAHNHQEVNALNLVERGAAAMILDRELSGERLAQSVAHLIADRQLLRRMSANARTFARPDAAERLVRSLERWAEGRGHAAPDPAGGGGR